MSFATVHNFDWILPCTHQSIFLLSKGTIFILNGSPQPTKEFERTEIISWKAKERFFSIIIIIVISKLRQQLISYSLGLLLFFAGCKLTIYIVWSKLVCHRRLECSRNIFGRMKKQKCCCFVISWICFYYTIRYEWWLYFRSKCVQLSFIKEKNELWNLERNQLIISIYANIDVITITIRW